MKTLSLLFLSLSLMTASFGQQSLTGLWTGSLSNDSTTIRKDQSFELALTEYRGKVYGYSRTAFIVHDTLFYTVKRLKGTIDGNVCEVKDDEVISTNFPGRQDKGVKVSYTFQQRQEDTTWRLEGNWKTNKTKNFYSVSGGIALRSEKNLDNSKLFPHLQELGKADDVAFYKEKKDAQSTTAKNNGIAKRNTPSVKQNEPDKPKQETAVVTTINKEVKKAQTEALTPAPELAKITAITPSAPIEPAAAVKERSNGIPQVVTFKSDSLVLALYDNGEIDGDTVSLLFNGQVIIAKQMLKASALKKTIYFPAGQEESTLLLYAENLGKFPPNTGLLVIHDGEETYQLRFSADLQTNASVIFRRKKN